MRYVLLLISLIIYSVSIAQINIDSDLIGKWKFDGDANEFIENEINGTLNQVISGDNRFGNESSSLYFDGRSSGVTFDQPLLPIDGSDWTLSVWFKNENPGSSTHEIIFSQYKYHDSESEYRFHIFLIDNEIRLFTGETGSVVLGDGNTEWNNVQITVDNQSLTAYLNGENVAEETITKVHNMNTTVGFDDVQTERRFKGYIDDLRIYPRALTETELKYILYDREPVCESLITVIDTVVNIIHDTVHVEVFDTVWETKNEIVYETVYDTLVMNFELTTNDIVSLVETKIYPNPADKTVNFEFDQEIVNTGCSIFIYNSLGERVISLPIVNNHESVEVSEIGMAGLYTVKVLNDDTNIEYSTKKLIIQ